jgi:hypothetical protein
MRSHGRLAGWGWVLGAVLPIIVQLACSESHIVAEGPNGEVTLFSDFPIGDTRRDLARGLLVSWQATPVRPERAFKLEVADSTGFRLRRNWRNLVFLADMRSRSWSAEQARKLMPETAYRHIASLPAGYALVPNAYADGQAILLLHATSTEALEALLREQGRDILDHFFDVIITGLSTTLYAAGEQTLMAQGIERRHGYRVRIPVGFFVEEQAENRFVRMKQVMPSGAVMYLFVYYQDQSGAVLSAPACMALRDTLASVYSSGDRIEPSRTTARRIEFLGRDAVEIYGLYQNMNPPMGGPFKSICFLEGGRLFLIDMSVFNPPGDKLPQLRMLEAIARTFTCEPRAQT